MSKASDIIAARPRQPERVDMAKLTPGLKNHDGKPVLEAWIRIPVVTTLERAAMEAHAHVVQSSARAREGKESYQSDADILSLAKQTALLWHAFRASPGPDSVELFPTAEWMRDELDAGTVAALVNAYLEIEARGPLMRPEITGDIIAEMVDLAGQDDGSLELELAQYGRTWVTALLGTVLRALAGELAPRELTDAERDGVAAAFEAIKANP